MRFQSSYSVDAAEKFSVIIAESDRAHAAQSGHVLRDDIATLDAGKRLAWRRILSGIATTEAAASILLGSIEAALSDDPQAQRLIKKHDDDERRHQRLFFEYVENTFNYRKTKPTPSDVIFYDFVMPLFSRLMRRRTRLCLVLLYWYELSSVQVYRHIRRLAAGDGLARVASFIASVEKDEYRHISGLQLLLAHRYKRTKAPIRLKTAAVQLLISFMTLDMSMRPWALHNRKMRACLVKIGLQPDIIGAAAVHAMRATICLYRDLPGATPS